MKQGLQRFIVGVILLFMSIVVLVIVNSHNIKYLVLLISGALLFYIYNLVVYDLNKKSLDEDIGESSSKKKSNYYFSQLDRGIIYFNESGMIVWQNRYSLKLLGRINRKKVTDLFPESLTKSAFTYNVGDQIFNVNIQNDTNIIEMIDVTQLVNLRKEITDNAFVIGYIFVDNLDELLQSDDPSGAETTAKVRKFIFDYISKYNIAIRTIRSDRYICITTTKIFDELVKDKFSLIEAVSKDEVLEKNAIGLTFGFAKGFQVLDELEEKANSAMELAQSRGGSQACIIEANKQAVFYGGNKEAHAKRSKVRLRLIKRSLTDIIKNSDRVWIMGHKYADLDALASCIGMYLIAKLLKKDVKILLDISQLDRATAFGFNDLASDYLDDVIDINQMDRQIQGNDVLIVVDVNKPSLVQYPELLEKDIKKVIFDHHRKTDTFMDNVILSHIEPYASSTAELVCEILELFDSNNFIISENVATLMLSGITVDTSNFRQKTGVRTFEVASYLKRLGASSVKIEQMLKVDFEDFALKSRIMSTATRHEVYPIIIATYDDLCTRAIIATVADQLLLLQGIKASFVIARDLDDDKIYNVSARSEGDVNVQLMMESLGGGGHFSKAACQIESDSAKDVYDKLYSLIDEYFEKERV